MVYNKTDLKFIKYCKSKCILKNICFDLESDNLELHLSNNYVNLKWRLYMYIGISTL